jgi:CO/xanthine dehydrogenase Mo-binding subunit
VLQNDRIFYGNQPIAIAVAETLEAAFESADRVSVHYQAQKPSVTLPAAGSNAYVPKKMGGAGDPVSAAARIGATFGGSASATTPGLSSPSAGTR